MIIIVRVGSILGIFGFLLLLVVGLRTPCPPCSLCKFNQVIKGINKESSIERLMKEITIYYLA